MLFLEVKNFRIEYFFCYGVYVVVKLFILDI